MALFYSGIFSQTTNTTTRKGMGELGASASVCPALYEFDLSCSAAPADNVITFSVMRFSASASATTFTPSSISQSPGIVTPIAALSWAAREQSATGTVTAGSEIWANSLNQRATFRWVAYPGGEIQAPAIASNGIYVGSLSPAYTGKTEATFNWRE